MRKLAGACIFLQIAVASSCRNEGTGSASRINKQTAPLATPTSKAQASGYTAIETLFYLRALSTSLVGRALSEAEIARVNEAPGTKSVSEIIQAWTREAGFIDAARTFVSLRLGVSGSKNGVNHDLPGNLAAHLVKNGLPYAEIITAGYCVSNAGEKIPCDTGAPYTAGVLTTQAFISAHSSRFNLRRARRFLEGFACKSYPVSQDLEPPLDQSELIPMFKEDRPPPGHEAGFGNGLNCYTCHSQFGVHAQFFVKFDTSGTWQAGATGVQGTGIEDGRSTPTLFTSHFADAARAGQEKSKMFGREAANLAEAAKILAETPEFLDCGSRSVIGHFLRLPPATDEVIGPGLLREIRVALLAKSPHPSFGDIVVQSLSHPLVIRSVLNSRGAQ